MKWFLLVLLMVFGCVEAEANGRTVVRSRTVVRGGAQRSVVVQRNVGFNQHANFAVQRQFAPVYGFGQAAAFAAPVYQYQAPVVLQAAPVYIPQQQFQFQQQYAPQRAVGGCGAALFGY